MKYRDLINRLLPFADEEISIKVSLEIEPADYMDTENWNEIRTETVNFFRNCDDNSDSIIMIEQKSDADSFENIGEVKFIKF